MTKKKLTNSSIKPKKEPKPTPDWEKLEIVIAEIQQALDPNALVKQGDQIRGKSGTIRKLDVSIKGKLGSNPVLIDIDAKHRGRPVGRLDVAGFHEQVDDIGPCIGIMISDYKFGSGAKNAAKRFNIILKTFTEATQTDWEQVFGSHPMLWLNFGEWKVHRVWIPQWWGTKGISEELYEIHVSTTLYTNTLQPYPLNPSGCVVGDLFSAYYEALPRPRPFGRFKIKIPQVNQPYYIHFTDNRLVAPPYIIVDGSMIYKKYPVTYEMAKGRALKSDLNNVEAMKIFTNQFTMPELRRSEKSIPLTKEEWGEFECGQSLAVCRVDDNHLYSIDFVATPPPPKK